MNSVNRLSVALILAPLFASAPVVSHADPVTKVVDQALADSLPAMDRDVPIAIPI